MPGSPTKPSRQAFGPKKLNYLGQAPLDARYFESQEEANLIRHQVTALGLLGELAKVVFTTAATTGAMVLVRHKYSWDQDLGDGSYVAPAVPVLARTSAGLYTVTIPAFGTDELGNAAVPVALLEAEAHAQADGAVIATATATGNVITVRCRLATDGSLTDTATDVLVRAGN